MKTNSVLAATYLVSLDKKHCQESVDFRFFAEGQDFKNLWKKFPAVSYKIFKLQTQVFRVDLTDLLVEPGLVDYPQYVLIV